MTDPVKPSPEFPPIQFPRVFADGIANFVVGDGIVKFYLYSQDPDVFGVNQSRAVAHVQIVMPVGGFTAAHVFFKKQVEAMLASGVIKQETLDHWDGLIQPIDNINVG